MPYPPYPPVTDELLQRVVERILSVGEPERIVLFGSHARGDAGPYSDLDLLIIEDSDQPRHHRSGKYYVALKGLFPDKEIVVWTPQEAEEWREVPRAFVTTALNQGRVLYERPIGSGARVGGQG